MKCVINNSIVRTRISTERQRQDGARRLFSLETPIILMTDQFDSGLREMVRRGELDDCLEKPFAAAQIWDLVERIIHAPRPEVAS